MAWSYLQVLLLTLVAWNPGSEDSAPGRVIAPVLQLEDSHDFGTVWSGEEVRHDFVLKNRGLQPVRILGIKTNCGCTVVNSYDKMLLPKKSTKISVVLKTKNLQGKVSKKIFVTTDREPQTDLTLSITGRVRSIVSMLPRSGATFGQVRQGEEVVRKIRLVSMVDQPLELKLPDVTKEFFDVSLTPITRGKEYELRFSFKAPEEPGSHRFRLELESNFKPVGSLSVMASAIVPARIEARPSKLVLPREIPKTMKRMVSVFNHGEKPMKVLAVRCTDKNLPVSFDVERATGTASITLQIPQGYKGTGTGAALVIQTDDPEFSEFRVPLKTVGNSPAVAKSDKSFDLPIRVEPPALMLDSGYTNDELTRSVQVLNLSGKSLELSLLDPGSQRFRVSVEELVAGEKFRIEVKVRPPIPLGPSQSAVRFSTNLESMPILTLPCTVYREAHVQAVPSSVILGPAVDVVRQFAISVSNKRQGAFRVVSASISDPRLSIAIERKKLGGSSIIRLTVPAGFEHPGKPLALKVFTDDPEFPELTTAILKNKAKKRGMRSRPERKGKSKRKKFGLRPAKGSNE